MKRFSEQIHKQAQTVKLKKSEQADLRERLVSYMEYHPLPAHMKQAAPVTSKKTHSFEESFSYFSIPYQSFFKFGSVAAVFVLLVVPFMAERSVPGDSLYAVKVQFNEEVRSTLTWGSYEKVEWETERLNRRIAEARLLADEGLLTEEVEASVAAAVKEHSDNAKREIEVLRASDADEATIAEIAFDSSLSVQAQALQNAIGGGEAAIDAVMTRSLISDALDESIAKPAEQEPASIPSYEKLLVRIELNTTRILELRDSLTGIATEQELTDVTRRIDDINRAIGEAVALAQVEETELAARQALVDVLARTQKLIVFMTDLEVRETVTIDSVVPVVPTEEEKAADRAERQTKLDAGIAAVEGAPAGVADVQAKIDVALEQLRQMSSDARQVELYKDYVVKSDEALTLLSDTMKLAGLASDSEEVPVVAPEFEPETAISSATTTPEVVPVDLASTSTPDRASSTDGTQS